MPTATRRLALAVLVLLASVAAHAGKQDFVLVNRTGLIIAELYVSASDTNDWEEDVLGRDVLAHGESVTITFDTRAQQCLYDIKTVDEDGDESMWTEIDLCRATRVTLKPKAVAEIAD